MRVRNVAKSRQVSLRRNATEANEESCQTLNRHRSRSPFRSRSYECHTPNREVMSSIHQSLNAAPNSSSTNIPRTSQRDHGYRNLFFKSCQGHRFKTRCPKYFWLRSFTPKRFINLRPLGPECHGVPVSKEGENQVDHHEAYVSFLSKRNET